MGTEASVPQFLNCRIGGQTPPSPFFHRLLFMDLTKLLNPQQLEAVHATDGPVLILAGAGSGKTRVITYRVAHLIENLHVRPDNILAVTFTNKAADQMKFRVRQLLGGARSSDPLISTFHSFCVRLLRREIEAI